MDAVMRTLDMIFRIASLVVWGVGGYFWFMAYRQSPSFIRFMMFDLSAVMALGIIFFTVKRVIEYKNEKATRARDCAPTLRKR